MGTTWSRRRLLQWGLAALPLAGRPAWSSEKPPGKGPADEPDGSGKGRPVKPKPADLARWRRERGRPYPRGRLGRVPGVASLPGPGNGRNWPDPKKYVGVEVVPGMCQLCSTVCGILGYVKDGRIIKIEGNPRDPNSRGFLCARGHAGLLHQYHPERLLYPMRRVGRRGEGKWKRISWDEALDLLADRLRRVRDSGKLEQFAFHQGRLRTKDAVKRFLRAFGTNTQLNHRGLCSANRRAANLTYLWESDWDLNDVEHTRYILNFGSNAFEAHQGHIPLAHRIQKARFEHGAKLVTFDVRLSNTAGSSDEWFAPFPGTDGAIALAMAHAILKAGKHDADFLENWTNVTIEELKAHLEPYTPSWAESKSGVPARDIERIALEFAEAAPQCTTLCNRGSSAHLNGYYNDRAIGLLNAVVGNVGKRGGWCWSPWSSIDPRLKPPPMPPAPSTVSILEDPPEYPLANAWRRMRVGEIVYLYLMQARERIQVYMTYNLDSPLTWPEESVTRAVLTDEDRIGFHVCITCFYSETAHYADLVLPWTTYLERWDLDARASYELRPYTGLRRPMVEPLGEARDIRDIFPDLARRIGGGMEKAYAETTEAYMRAWAAGVPENPKTGKSGLDRLLDEGVWESEIEPYYEPYLRPLAKEELEGAQIDPETGIIRRDGIGIGILFEGRPVRGFATPSRKFEIRSVFVARTGRNEDCSPLIAQSGVIKTRNRPEHHKGHVTPIDPMPVWFQIEEHRALADDELIMTSFKWNVHNHGRTMNLKWLAEIVHSNPAWIHPETARRLGLSDGDWVEITAYHSRELLRRSPHLFAGRSLRTDARGRVVAAKMRVPVVIMPGIHPRVIAMSNSCGHWQYTSVAQARRKRPDGGHLAGSDPDSLRDGDWERNMWWEDPSGGTPGKWKPNTGNGWNQNRLLPIAPDPVTGQQAYHDTVVIVRKLETAAT